jgi:adenylate cyclase
VNAEEARQLRHELRTPVNHLIGYSELLLEEGDSLSAAERTLLETLCAQAREVLEIIPGLLTPEGKAGEGVARLRALAAQLNADTRSLAASSAGLPAADLQRLCSAAARLGEFAERLGQDGGERPADQGHAEAPRTGHLEMILVVDDDEANREVLGRRLQRLGYGVTEARDGVEALAAMAAGGIDLVLLDVMMPNLDGFGVLDRHRADPAIRDIPVIMISALDDMASIVRCIEAGATDYLTKPFDPVLLKARVTASLEKKRLHDEEKSLRTQVESQAAELRAWNEQLEQRVADQVRQVERLNQLRRFLPPQVADAISDGGIDQLSSHRREVTVLFCDLRGFTPFAERSEPEDVMQVLGELHGALGPLVFAHGGTLSQFTGDGMLVIFNDPVPCEDPAGQAVALALAMRDRAETLSSTWRGRGHELRLGVGIATGYATCGRVGFEGRYEYAAIGTVTNLAARLCAEAQGGQVLISQRIATLLDGRVQAQPLGEVQFKGIAKPVPIWVVEGLQVSAP